MRNSKKIASLPRLRWLAVAAAFAALLLSQAAVAQPKPAQPPAKAVQPGPADNEITQEFPAGGPAQTAWKVRYKLVSPGPGLIITGAWLKTDANADWMKPAKIVMPKTSGRPPSFSAASDGSRKIPVWHEGQRNPLPTGPLANDCRIEAIPIASRASASRFTDEAVGSSAS